jgi:hypothetical protein
MNDIQLDTRLVAATNRRSDDTNTFVNSTMQKIKVLHAADSLAKPPAPTRFWQRFGRLPMPQRIALGVLTAVVISIASFTSYAYATGSDPVSLIKRWVEGDKVKVEYQGRQFEYGKTRNYSDAAITALAEANTVWGLNFKATNDLQVPKTDGYEYVDVPQSDRAPFQYPYLATVTLVSPTEVTIHKVYLWGDKMNPSHDLNETANIPAPTFRYFAKGEPVSPAAALNGTLIMVFPSEAIRHRIGTKDIAHEDIYFSFALTHDLASFKEVAAKGLPESDNNSPLFETSWGGLGTICGNNGADTCDISKMSQPGNHGLFVAQKGPNALATGYNPDAIQFGEAIPMNGLPPTSIISRNLEGKISAISATSITITTSSGAHWQLAYTTAEQDAFAQRFGTGLRVGDKLGGTVLESITNLDNRNIDHQHIMSFERYK